MAVAIGWMGMINPSAPAWSRPGGPLWAIRPLVLPVMPILLVVLLVVAARVILWLVRGFLYIVEWVIKLIELIPGM